MKWVEEATRSTRDSLGGVSWTYGDRWVDRQHWRQEAVTVERERQFSWRECAAQSGNSASDPVLIGLQLSSISAQADLTITCSRVIYNTTTLPSLLSPVRSTIAARSLTLSLHHHLQHRGEVCGPVTCWMWTRFTLIHRTAVCTTATLHCRRALLSTTSTSTLLPRTFTTPPTMSTTSLSSAASKPSNLPAQLTDMCMTHTHFQAFQGNPLNKLHLHRKDEQHIQSLQSHPAARFLVLNTRLQPLLRTLPALPTTATTANSAPPTASLASIRTPLSTRSVIAWLTAEQLSNVLSQSPIAVLLGQVDNEAPIAATVTAEGELIETGVQSTQAGAANDGSLEEDAPYHAVLLQSDAQSSQLIASLPSTADSSYSHADLRLSLPSLNYTDASILAQARALLEWHQSTLYCGRCGSPTQSLEGGAKRQCTAPQPLKGRSSATPAAAASTSGSAAVVYCGRTLYPRTDSVTITLTVSNDGSRVLLGRKKEFPAGVYTCLAGFLEGGETPEEGARREVWEESGVCVSAVRYFASQPWPFLGGQLMIGCFAQVDPTIMQNKTAPRQPLPDNTDTHSSQSTLQSLTVEEAERIELLDGELESVRWFTRDDIGAMLTASRQHPDAWSRPDAFSVGEMRVPPCYAIAHQLIAHWYLYGADVLKENGGAGTKEMEALLSRGRQYGNLNLQGRFIAHL